MPDVLRFCQYHSDNWRCSSLILPAALAQQKQRESVRPVFPAIEPSGQYPKHADHPMANRPRPPTPPIFAPRGIDIPSGLQHCRFVFYLSIAFRFSFHERVGWLSRGQGGRPCNDVAILGSSACAGMEGKLHLNHYKELLRISK